MILLPIVITMVFLVIHAALVYHGRSVVAAAAEDAARAAQVEASTAADGRSVAFTVLAGSDRLLPNPSVIVERSPNRVSVTVSAAVSGPIPWLHPTVTASAGDEVGASCRKATGDTAAPGRPWIGGDQRRPVDAGGPGPAGLRRAGGPGRRRPPGRRVGPRGPRARAASLRQAGPAAEADALDAARATLRSAGLECASTSVSVDLGRGAPRGAITATVTCQARLADLVDLALPGEKAITATGSRQSMCTGAEHERTAIQWRQRDRQRPDPGRHDGRHDPGRRHGLRRQPGPGRPPGGGRCRQPGGAGRGAGHRRGIGPGRCRSGRPC